MSSACGIIEYMKRFENVRVYVENQGIVTSDVVFDKNIVAVGAECLRGEYASAEKVTVPDGCTVFPAFIDEHMHGACGADFMDGTAAAFDTICDAIAREGTARVLATTMTASVADTLRVMRAVKAYTEAPRALGAAIMGVHLEGPFLSVKRAGAQPVEYIIAPDLSVFDAFDSACGGRVMLITLAPETAGAADFIRTLSARGVTCSIGHTDADYDCAVAAKNAGAKCVTHTYNAQSPFTHRAAGTVGAALLEDGLRCELIADGIHVSHPAVRLLVNNKPRGGIILITDAMRAKGMPDGRSELGGQEVFVSGGEVRLADGTLAGSVLTMNRAVAFLVEKAGMSVADAVDCATINPARNLGIDGEYGSIRVGKAADFVVLDPKFTPVATFRDGSIIYSAN